MPPYQRICYFPFRGLVFPSFGRGFDSHRPLQHFAKSPFDSAASAQPFSPFWLRVWRVLRGNCAQAVFSEVRRAPSIVDLSSWFIKEISRRGIRMGSHSWIQFTKRHYLRQIRDACRDPVRSVSVHAVLTSRAISSVRVARRRLLNFIPYRIGAQSTVTLVFLACLPTDDEIFGRRRPKQPSGL